MAKAKAGAKAPTVEKFKVTVPNPTFTGVRGGVRFEAGVGYTDDPAEAQWCREMGYRVEELPADR